MVNAPDLIAVKLKSMFHYIRLNSHYFRRPPPAPGIEAVSFLLPAKRYKRKARPRPVPYPGADAGRLLDRFFPQSEKSTTVTFPGKVPIAYNPIRPPTQVPFDGMKGGRSGCQAVEPDAALPSTMA